MRSKYIFLLNYKSTQRKKTVVCAFTYINVGTSYLSIHRSLLVLYQQDCFHLQFNKKEMNRRRSDTMLRINNIWMYIHMIYIWYIYIYIYIYNMFKKSKTKESILKEYHTYKDEFEQLLHYHYTESKDLSEPSSLITNTNEETATTTGQHYQYNIITIITITTMSSTTTI